MDTKTELTPARVKEPRHWSTYRYARRADAKTVYRINRTNGETIRGWMRVAPPQENNLLLNRAPIYQKYSKTSPKVYRGGNYPGSVRRESARASVTA